MTTIYEQSCELHKQLGGKIEISLKKKPEGMADLALLYSPGVAGPCLEIQKDPTTSFDYTRRKNLVAVISNGTAVLGLGNIGALAGLPVMEGKSLLLKEFGNVDSIPLVINETNPDKLIEIICSIADNFGGINLEDIKAPECFYIEEELNKRLSIPVFHDDQHGTAIVVLAGTINALKLTNRSAENTTATIIGAGAAGIAVGKLLHHYGIKNIRMVDSQGVIHKDRTDLNQYKEYFVATNLDNIQGSMENALVGSDIVVGLSQPGLLTLELIKTMAKDPIIFALANPTPEIMPDLAYEAGAAVVATGRSDFPNQVNNVLAFPGLFRGMLDNKISKITNEHKIIAAKAIASMIENPTRESIIPGAFTPGVAERVAGSFK